MQKGEGKQEEVTREDQNHINTFGRLNTRLHELKDEIKAKKDYAESLDDAGNELMLSDEEEVRWRSGEVFIYKEKDELEQLLERLKEKTSDEVTQLEGEKEKVELEMAKLKKILYGKFKDQINLEDE